MSYLIGQCRRSYKRDGRLGWGWAVITAPPLSVRVAMVDTEAEALALKAALDDERVEPGDVPGMRAVVRAALVKP
jgi:hypothetical protein